MTRLILSSLVLLGGLMIPPAARAQLDPYDPYYRGADRTRPVGLMDRVVMDLSQVESDYKLGEHSRKSIKHAKENLRKFQDNWQRGKFDDGNLKDAINDLQQLNSAREVRGRDRDLLSDDLRDLRDFRATRGRSDVYERDRYRYRYWRDDDDR